MDVPTASTPIEADARRSVRDETCCTTCGYSLRGLDANGTCPECGAPIAWSTGEDPIRYRDPRWLGGIAHALAWQIGATTLTCIHACLWLVPGFGEGDEPADTPLPWLLYIVSSFLNWFAAWYVTRPEPGAANRWLSLRVAIRVVVTVAFAGSIVLLLPGWNERNAILGEFALNTLSQCDVLFWYLYVRTLSLRIGRPGLAFAWLATLVGGIISGGIAWWYPSFANAAWLFNVEVPWIGGMLPWAGTLVASACTVVLCALLRRSFTTLALEAPTSSAARCAGAPR